MCRQGLGVLLCAVVVASASPPGLTVSAAGAFKINETEVPATAASEIPVGVGDEVSTSDVSAVLRVGNEAVVILAPRSLIKTEQKRENILVHLVAGSLEYKLVPQSKVAILNRDKAVGPGLRGVISAPNRGKTLPLALMSAAGAGAVVATAALVRRSQTCPDGTPADHDCSAP